jgi:hypothetical protein
MSLYSKLYEALSGEACFGNETEPYPAIAGTLALFKAEIDGAEEDRRWRSYLQISGVTNWSGYGAAIERYLYDKETT